MAAEHISGEDGTVKLALTSAGRLWFELVPKEANGATTLTLEVPQQKYVLEQVKAPAAP